MEERLEFLRELGVDVVKAARDFPPLLGCSISRNFIPVLDYLESIPVSRASLPLIVQKYPRILYSSVVVDLMPVVNFLLGLGVQKPNLERVLACYPQILGSKLEGNMSTAVAYLVSVGVALRSVGGIVTECPEILGMPVGEDLLPKVGFLVGLGITKEKVAQIIERQPQILMLPLETQLRPTVQALLEAGVQADAVGAVVAKFPDLLGLAMSEVLARKAAWLVDEVGVPESQVAQVITRLPQILAIDEDHARTKISFLVKRGFTAAQVAGMVAACPQILGLSITASLAPRLDFLVDIMRRPLVEAAEYPAYFMFSVERLRPRYEKVQAAGLKCSLPWMLGCSDEAFLELLAQEEVMEGPAFVDFVEGPLRQPSRQVVLCGHFRLLLDRDRVPRSLWEAHGDFEAVVVRHLLHEGVDVVLGRGQRRAALHGGLDELRLHLHVVRLLLELVHGLGDLLEVVGGERGVEGLDDVAHGLGDDVHLGLRVEARDDGVEARGQAQVVELLRALADGVLGVDARAVHVALLDGALHLELLLLLLLLALLGLAHQRLGREAQLEDLLQQLLLVAHASGTLPQRPRRPARSRARCLCRWRAPH
eukprot:SM000004S14896  [mRNA]  locus=s4:51571:54763:- [translate_table: standard]